MITEVKIILEPDVNKSANGSVLERLVRDILEKQEYAVDPNVHFAGLEIDLLAKHKYKNETLYVECKAKEKPKSTEIKTFIWGVDYGVDGGPADYGYFIHTEELDRQAAALKIQFENQKRNISFIGPDKIVSLLTDMHRIKKLDYSDTEYNISKLILAYTYFGVYYILLLQNSAISEYFTVLNAKDLSTEKDTTSAKLVSTIKEIKDLNLISLDSFTKIHQSKPQQLVKSLDTVTEIKESEKWYDYSPASIKHFIGRNFLRKDLLDFIENVRNDQTKNRIFYLDGKSGWGKSSVIAELRGRSKNKFLAKKIFVLAIDTRSASTNNFIALAFKKLIEDAMADGFIPKGLFNQDIRFASPYDILADISIKEILQYLKTTEKVLVIVFDQFEDVFRKEDLFEAFYKFLIDVNDSKENIVVGFSWKTEINIPIGNSAYHQFIQIKDYALNLRIPEFGLTDVKNVLKQLSNEIGKPLGNELERRLIDASQGFPWLIKKLCIHTYQQFNEGKTLEELVEQDLNIKSLFDSDLEKLTQAEATTLRFIANKAFNEDSLDISELESVDEEALQQLIHKRLVINTGSKYNIYWDIFRDYLVTGDIPVIGESYLIRQSFSSCETVYLTFQTGTKNFEELVKEHSSSFTKKTLFNVLIELRSLGLIRKKENSDIYEVTAPDRPISKKGFADYLSEKLKNYTPFIELNKIEKRKFSVDDFVLVLKSIFKTSNFQEKTWKAYALNLVTWFAKSNLLKRDRILEVRKGRQSSSYEHDENIILYNTPSYLIESFRKYQNDERLAPRIARDMLYLKMLTPIGEKSYLQNEWAAQLDDSYESFLNQLANNALEFNKIKIAYTFIKMNPHAKSGNLLSSHPELTTEFKTELSKRQINSVIHSWAKFVYEVLDSGATQLRSNRAGPRNKTSLTFLSFTPNDLLESYLNFEPAGFPLSHDQIRLINFLKKNNLLSNDIKESDKMSKEEFLKALTEFIINDEMFINVAKMLKQHGKIKIAQIMELHPEYLNKYSTMGSKTNRWSKITQWSRLLL